MIYLVLNTDGLIVNLIICDAGFDPGETLTTTILSKYPAAKIGDSIIDGKLVPAPEPEPQVEE
jgi:hypothetical protein